MTCWSASTCGEGPTSLRFGRDPRRRQGRLPPVGNSLIQTIGARRAQRRRPRDPLRRHDHRIDRAALAETDRRRESSSEYNVEHGITPESIKRNVHDIMAHLATRDGVVIDTGDEERPHLVGQQPQGLHRDLESACARPGRSEFEDAPRPARRIRRLEEDDLGIPTTTRRPGPGQFPKEARHRKGRFGSSSGRGLAAAAAELLKPRLTPSCPRLPGLVCGPSGRDERIHAEAAGQWRSRRRKRARTSPGRASPPIGYDDRRASAADQPVVAGEIMLPK